MPLNSTEVSGHPLLHPSPYIDLLYFPVTLKFSKSTYTSYGFGAILLFYILFYLFYFYFINVRKFFDFLLRPPQSLPRVLQFLRQKVYLCRPILAGQ